MVVVPEQPLKEETRICGMKPCWLYFDVFHRQLTSFAGYFPAAVVYLRNLRCVIPFCQDRIGLFFRSTSYGLNHNIRNGVVLTRLYYP